MSRANSKETLAGFRHITDVMDSAIQEHANLGASSPLKDQPGKGKTIFDLGLPRLLGYAAQMGMNQDGLAYTERRAREQYAKGVQSTESPIERSMLAALITGWWVGFETLPPLVHTSNKDSLEVLPLGDIVIVPQMAFVKFRFDFGLVLEKDGRRQIAVIECDGADFHRDADKDRFRDLYLHSWNIPTFRCKGSAIFEDAIKAADEVINKICMWKAS